MKLQRKDLREAECFASQRHCYNPTNAEEAFAFQFHSDVRNLYAMAHVSHKSFYDVLVRLEANIDAYKQLNPLKP